MRDWIHWLWQRGEWSRDQAPELSDQVVQAEEELLAILTPEQRKCYLALESVSARHHAAEVEAAFCAGVFLGGGLMAEIFSESSPLFPSS